MATAFPLDDGETEDPPQTLQTENEEDQPLDDVAMDETKPLTPDQLKDKLEKNLSSLINHLEVERILPKLRDAQLLDKRDAEIISSEYKHPSSSDKAGALLDRVVTRGPKAIQLLFDHVEKQHPDLYKEITGREPTITITRMHTILKRKKGGLPAELTMTILTQLTAMMEEKEKQEKELDQRNRDLADRERKIQGLKGMNRKMNMKVKALQSKKEERDKLQTELTHRTTMLKEVQNKLLKCQREAEKAKHHARMATFKNFHLEYELREMSNKMNIQRRQTRNLQRSVKNHEKWLSEHNVSYTFDHRKVEELQKELEKIDDFRKSVAIGEEVCEISERVQSQLSKARDTNEGLNLRLQRTQEKNDGLKGEIDLLKKERTMMKETMHMNRMHLEMSQRELEIVSRERVKLNEAYEELLKDMSQSFLNTSSLQERLARVRLDYAVLSERMMNAGDGSVDTSGIFPYGDVDDDLLDDDDTGVDGEDGLESEDDVIIPVPRQRLKRMVSSSSSCGPKLDQMKKALTDSFEKDTSSSSRSHTMTSSSSTTTGDEDPTNSLDIGRISGFPDYRFRGSSDDADDADDDDDDVDSMAQRMSRLEADFEFMENQSTAVRSRPRTRRRPRLSDNRRSRSLSRLEDYETFENMDFLQPQPGCYSMLRQTICCLLNWFSQFDGPREQTAVFIDRLTKCAVMYMKASQDPRRNRGGKRFFRSSLVEVLMIPSQRTNEKFDVFRMLYIHLIYFEEVYCVLMMMSAKSYLSFYVQCPGHNWTCIKMLLSESVLRIGFGKTLHPMQVAAFFFQAPKHQVEKILQEKFKMSVKV